jgi:CheY-like chemotaxis protein
MTNTDNVAKKVILVVDDLAFDAEFTLQALGKYDGRFEVDVARDGWDALVLMKDRHFDLILMDLKMPRMDGFETMILMRGYQLQHDVPLIILTNSDLDADRDRARQLGAADYVHKSADLAQYKAVLQATVEKHVRL